jgi:hypothetical protein
MPVEHMDVRYRCTACGDTVELVYLWDEQMDRLTGIDFMHYGRGCYADE